MEANVMTPDFGAYSLDSLALNLIVVKVIQMMKLSNAPLFRWINNATPSITKLLSAICAAASAAGMMVQWETTQGSGTLTISGISMTAVVTFVFICIKNYLFQDTFYKVAFKPNQLPEPTTAEAEQK